MVRGEIAIYGFISGMTFAVTLMKGEWMVFFLLALPLTVVTIAGALIGDEEDRP